MAGADFNAESVNPEHRSRMAMCQSSTAVLALMRVTLLEIEKEKNRACGLAVAGELVAGEASPELALFETIVENTQDTSLMGLLRAGMLRLEEIDGASSGAKS
jgi:hypothetical protein